MTTSLSTALLNYTGGGVDLGSLFRAKASHVTLGGTPHDSRAKFSTTRQEWTKIKIMKPTQHLVQQAKGVRLCVNVLWCRSNFTSEVFRRLSSLATILQA